jgi:hypothetical protein
MNTTMQEHKGYAQLKAIISEIMELDQENCSGHGFPKMDFVNGVLSHERFGDIRLWFWFGDVRIVKPGQTTAGEMEILNDWNTGEDGTFTFYGRRR